MQIAMEEGVRSHDTDWNKITNLINSAIWRRKDDLFLREGELLKLRTTDFELVDNARSKDEEEAEQEM